MGDTIWEQASETHFDELSTEDPQCIWEIVKRYKKLLSENEYDLGIFGQFHQERFVTPAQILDFAFIRKWLDDGDLTGAIIPLGYEPSKDSEIEENNKKLSVLPEWINAKFFGGLGDDDGYIKFHEPLTLTNDVCGVSRLFDKGVHFPLEVGYTSFTRSYFHLLTQGYLARWPYHSKNIYLFALNYAKVAAYSNALCLEV